MSRSRRLQLLLAALLASVMGCLFFPHHRSRHRPPPVAENKSFVVVIPSYNNGRYCEQNLFSVLQQDYPQFRVIFIDDHSTDDTLARADQMIAHFGTGREIAVWRNPERLGALHNLYRAIHSCEANEVVVCVDGDDMLAHPQVLSYLNRVYADPDVWMTYGSFMDYPAYRPGEVVCRKIPSSVFEQGKLRRQPWRSSHLRTFYAGLFHQIDREDLLWNGEFFPMAGDLAMMFPLLEMSGSHAHFLSKVLYLYNRENPLNDHKVDVAFQEQLAQTVRARPPYAPLPQRPF